MMYNKILVPLDGSEFSECSLQHVKAIAMGCQVPEVVLLRVVEPLSSKELSALAEIRRPPIEEIEAEKKSEATDYISRTVQQFNTEGVLAKGEVITGRAGETILDYTEKNKVDLIIMSTHGKSGITRWAFGSVADRVVRHSTVPVLTVAPAGCRINQTQL
jgi:nucleotide-binding universal stress UspA family protein